MRKPLPAPNTVSPKPVPYCLNAYARPPRVSSAGSSEYTSQRALPATFRAPAPTGLTKPLPTPATSSIDVPELSVAASVPPMVTEPPADNRMFCTVELLITRLLTSWTVTTPPVTPIWLKSLLLLAPARNTEPEPALMVVWPATTIEPADCTMLLLMALGVTSVRLPLAVMSCVNPNAAPLVRLRLLALKAPPKMVAPPETRVQLSSPPTAASISAELPPTVPTLTACVPVGVVNPPTVSDWVLLKVMPPAPVLAALSVFTWLGPARLIPAGALTLKVLAEISEFAPSEIDLPTPLVVSDTLPVVRTPEAIEPLLLKAMLPVAVTVTSPGPSAPAACPKRAPACAPGFSVTSAALMLTTAVALVWLMPAPIAAPARVGDTPLPVMTRLPTLVKLIVTLPMSPVPPRPMKALEPVVPLVESSVVLPATLIVSVCPLAPLPPMLAKLSLVPVPPVRSRPPAPTVSSCGPPLTKMPAPLETPPLPPRMLTVAAETDCSPVPLLEMSPQEPLLAGVQVEPVPIAVPPVSDSVPVVETVCVPALLKMPEFLPAVAPPRTVIDPLWPPVPAVMTWLLPVM